MDSKRSFYDDLRRKCCREARLSWVKPSLRRAGPAWNGAYAMPYNPFDQVVRQKKQAERRARLRLVGR
jgi:hypothetical protein